METNDIIIRIREVFKKSGKSQTEIGKAINKTPQYIWRLINVDDVNPSKSVISDICREFNVNEEWILNGIPPMEKYSDTDEYSEIATIIGETDQKAKQAIIEYWKLSESDKELFWKFVERFILKKEGD